MTTQDSALELIDLNDMFRKQQELQAVVKSAAVVLQAANEQLSEFNTSASQTIRESLAHAGTTGDPLQDEVLSSLGLNREYIYAILAFNSRLMAASGSELLLAVDYKTRFCWREDYVSDRDCQQNTGYILGVLSGERIKLENSGPGIFDVSVIIPFERSVLWGFGLNKGFERKDGSLSLLSGLFGSGSINFLCEILGIEHQHHVQILFGAEIEQSKHLLPLDLNPAREVLNAATVEEQVARDGI